MALGAVAIGCALVSTAAGAATGKTPVIGATVPGAVNDKAPAPMAPAAISAKAPPGYAVVTGGTTSAPTGTQTRGTATCPAGTVPWGGGAVISGSNINLNLNSSFPSGSAWVADVNNVSGSTGLFNVYVVCAVAPRKYTVVESSAFTSPADGQAEGTVSCPANTVVLGGGSLSNSGSVAVNLNSTLPNASTSWRADQNTNTSTSSTFEVFAICGKQRRKWAIVSGSSVPNPPSSQTLATVTCPAGTVPLSGGGYSSSASPAVDLNSTAPISHGWEVYEDNTSGAGTPDIQAWAVCA
jgi:hypothetical protein